MLTDKKDVQGDTSKDSSLTDDLYDDIRILCWFSTTPSNQRIRGIHVKKTWSKWCINLFLCAQNMTIHLMQRNCIKYESQKCGDVMGGKTKCAFQYVYQWCVCGWRMYRFLNYCQREWTSTKCLHNRTTKNHDHSSDSKSMILQSYVPNENILSTSNNFMNTILQKFISKIESFYWCFFLTVDLVSSTVVK